MATLTTAQEYAAVRAAIQELTTTGTLTTMRSVDGMSESFSATSQLALLQAREIELARRLTVRNTRKRTVPEFY